MKSIPRNDIIEAAPSAPDVLIGIFFLISIVVIIFFVFFPPYSGSRYLPELCLSAGYSRWKNVGDGYCIKQVQGSDIVVPAGEVG